MITRQRNQQLQARYIEADDNRTCFAWKLYKDILTYNSSQMNYLYYKYFKRITSRLIEVVTNVIMNILNKYGIFKVFIHRKQENPRMYLNFQIITFLLGCCSTPERTRKPHRRRQRHETLTCAAILRIRAGPLHRRFLECAVGATAQFAAHMFLYDCIVYWSLNEIYETNILKLFA